MSANLVIIPTYNEIENIEKMIRTVFALPREFDLLIVDDGSPDGTALKVKELQAEFPNKLHIEERKGKLGLGTAYIHGFRWALNRDFQYIFEMDCDFSHNPEDLIRKGIVTFFNDTKGYGFIKDLETQESVFVHINSLTEEVKENNKVTFEVEMGPKGANAVNVNLVR